MEEDEDDEVLEAGFSEREDGTGIAVMFQRDIFADDPWEGSEDETDFFNNSYCVTTGAGATSYGGVLSIDLSQQPAVFKLSPRVANTLKLDEVIEVDFNVPEQDWNDFRTVLRRVVTWGVPSQVPEVRGF
ncbi:Imm10 family immunity protein [Streptomyces sp. NPDC056486]|uniref:Imm10 family immunity protein n=1 Tax=Streptomyces sp. NPDC056486 TaxID=3345835 RepID=UPI0036BDCD7D